MRNKGLSLNKNYDGGLTVIDEVTMEQRSGALSPIVSQGSEENKIPNFAEFLEGDYMEEKKNTDHPNL